MATADNPKYKVIGTRPVRHDGADKVTGRAKYGADISFDGHAAWRYASQPSCSRQYQEHRYVKGRSTPRRSSRCDFCGLAGTR